VALRSGLKISVDPSDYLQLLLYYCGTFEPHLIKLLSRYVPNGGTVLDVGANIGVFTLESAQLVGPSGCVIAIEAAPPNLELLRRNIAINRIDHVVVVESGASDKPGIAKLSLPDGGNRGMFTLGATRVDEGFTVELETIDQILSRVPMRRLDLIKMDIEGSEYRALLGATKTLSEYKPAIMIELNEEALHACGSASREVKQLLASFKYQGFIVKSDGQIVPIADTDHHECDECLFICYERAVLNVLTR
jgi:FkbM family methyltransferase